MYALAVLAIRILLVDGENTLAIAVDEMLSLAREAAIEHKPNVALGKGSRPSSRETRAGRHRLARTGWSERKAFAKRGRIIPADLWWETIGVIIRLFPGIGTDRFCRDLGDAPSSALDQIFDDPITQIDLLLLRSRSLVVADWNQNLEIHDAIYEVIAKKHGTLAKREKFRPLIPCRVSRLRF